MYKYDFAFSFAGEDRVVAEKLAELLQREKIRVFFYPDEEADTWGKDLEQKLPQIYVDQSRFFVPIVSANYIAKAWTMFEFNQAQTRDSESNTGYILPLRLDDTELPGLKETIAYIDLRSKSVNDVSELLQSKLVRDSATRQLFLFLRDNNPAAIDMLESKPEQLVIRVATAKAHLLEQIIAKIDPHICKGKDQHNMFMNGVFGPPGCIPSVDPEPHTTFSLFLSEDFYKEFSA